MQTTSVHTRPATRLLVPLVVGALVLLGACAPQPDPTTPWLEPGCLDSDIPGVPDFRFNGIANVKDNATAYLDGDVYVDDGSCSGATQERGTIVRAASHDAAIAACTSVGVPVHDPGRLVDFGYAAPVDGWACANVTEAPELVQFDSPAVVAVTMTSEDPEDPENPRVTTVDFAGSVTGTWDQVDGDFALGLEVDDGSFHVENSPIGAIDVFYTAAQTSGGLGSFDFATGEGGFTLGVTMTLVGLNAPSGMPQPCDILTTFDFSGAIDMDSGELVVSQDEFELLPPGAADCGGLGALIAPMLEGGSNAATMTFQVL